MATILSWERILFSKVKRESQASNPLNVKRVESNVNLGESELTVCLWIKLPVKQYKLYSKFLVV